MHISYLVFFNIESRKGRILKTPNIENIENVELLIIFYFVGPLDTAMVEEVMESTATNSGILESFKKMKSEGQVSKIFETNSHFE